MTQEETDRLLRSLKGSVTDEVVEMFRLLMMGSAATSCGWWKGQRCRMPGQCYNHGRLELMKRLGVPVRLVRL
jgi:hypothetical protein